MLYPRFWVLIPDCLRSSGRMVSGRGLDPGRFHGRRPQFLQDRDKIPYLRGEFRRLGGRDPCCPQPTLVQAVEGKQLSEEADPFSGGVITIQVIAVPDVSTAHEQPVHPLLESEQHVVHGDAATAHNPHDPDVCGILKPTDPGQVSSGIGSPSAEKAKHLGLEIGLAHDEFTSLL